MSTESFKQDSLGWRIDLLKQRVGEWIEFKTSQLDGNGLDFSFFAIAIIVANY